MQTRTLPNTIDDAYNAVNPTEPLKLGSDDPRYVDCSSARGGDDEVSIMARAISRSTPPDYFKRLFTGHRGCGKSTELFRLKRKLERDNYFVVYFNVVTELEIGDLDFPDVLLTIAQQTEAQLRAAGVELNPRLLENTARWFGKTLITETQGRDVETTLQSEYGLGIKAPFVVFASMLAAFKGTIKNSSDTRVQYRSELQRKATELIQSVNTLIGDAQERLKRSGKAGLVLIVDGLDQLSYRMDDKTKRSSHDLVFIDHGEQLRSPTCHIVFTFPINLIFNQHLGQIWGPKFSILPMIKINEKDGSPCATGRELLRDVIGSRMNVNTIFDDPALVDELVLMSGGHVRDLIRLVRNAFDYTDTTVSAAEVQKAMRDLVNEYEYLTQDEALPLLRDVHRTKDLPNDEAHSLLLYKLLVLEYRSGEPWYDVHPAVQATRKFKEFKPAKAARAKKERAPKKKK